jgi:hypothetical protein
MKKAAVPTTAASGTAVSRSRITAVQSVYIPVSVVKTCPSSQPSVPCRSPRGRRLPPSLAALTLLVLALPQEPGRAGVQFENCVRGPGGSLTCDTVPTGDTLLNDRDAQFGLFQNASPGWNEFNPFQGYDEDFGDDPS